MSHYKIKQPSTTARNVLLWMVLVAPLVGLATFMLASQRGLDHVTCAELTGGVVTAWWLVTFVVVRVVHWRKRTGPSSLPPNG